MDLGHPYPVWTAGSQRSLDIGDRWPFSDRDFASRQQSGAPETAHGGVVHERVRCECDGSGSKPHEGDYRSHRIEIFRIESRNDLRNPARAAGELEDDDLVRIKVDGVDQYARLLGVLRFNQFLEREGAGFGRPTEHLDHIIDRRDGLRGRAGEADHVEPAVVAMYEMSLGGGVISNVGDFLLAVSCERADRDDPDLQAGKECLDQLLAVSDLE